eukprot:XP_019928285.1 PREDICTED: uncharacterized protein LOC105342006 [Crassostrea gigas]
MDRLGKMDVTTTANVSIKPQAATSVPRGAHPSLLSLAASLYQARQTTAAKYSTVHPNPTPIPTHHPSTTREHHSRGRNSCTKPRLNLGTTTADYHSSSHPHSTARRSELTTVSICNLFI